MRLYQPRKIAFREIAAVDEWKVKVYAITNNSSFQAEDVLKRAVAKLPLWLKASAKLGLPTYQMACLIVHEGRDGVWSLLSWWIGGEMLQNITYFTPFEKRDEFSLLPEKGSMACVWELAVIGHERKAWIEHILKEPDAPKFSEYLQDVINDTI